MTAVLATPAPVRPSPVSKQPVATSEATNHAIVLKDVTWEMYVSLRDSPANAGLRMTFDQGVLEVVTLSIFHELISLLIHDFILEWRVARNVNVQPGGSMTLRRALLNQGLEGDQSYYIRNEAQIRSKKQINLDSDPAPDLVVEVDHTSSSVQKMPIYAALRVPEVWRWTQEDLKVYVLVDEAYEERDTSEALPGFPLDQLRIALKQRFDENETVLVRAFREWLQANAAKE